MYIPLRQGLEAIRQQTAQQQNSAYQGPTITQPGGSPQPYTGMSPTGPDPATTPYRVVPHQDGSSSLYVQQGYHATVVNQSTNPQTGEVTKQYAIQPVSSVIVDSAIQAHDIESTYRQQSIHRGGTSAPNDMFGPTGVLTKEARITANLNPEQKQMYTETLNARTMQKIGNFGVFWVSVLTLPVTGGGAAVTQVAKNAVIGAGLSGGMEYVTTGKITPVNIVTGAVGGVVLGNIASKAVGAAGFVGRGLVDSVGRVAVNTGIGMGAGAGIDIVQKGTVTPESVLEGGAFGLGMGVAGEGIGAVARRVDARYDISGRVTERVNDSTLVKGITGRLPNRVSTVQRSVVRQPTKISDNQVTNFLDPYTGKTIRQGQVKQELPSNLENIVDSAVTKYGIERPTILFYESSNPRYTAYSNSLDNTVKLPSNAPKTIQENELAHELGHLIESKYLTQRNYEFLEKNFPIRNPPKTLTKGLTPKEFSPTQKQEIGSWLQEARANDIGKTLSVSFRSKMTQGIQNREALATYEKAPTVRRSSVKEELVAVYNPKTVYDSQLNNVESITRKPLVDNPPAKKDIYGFDLEATNKKISTQLKNVNDFDINRVNSNIEKTLAEAALERASQQNKPAKFITGIAEDKGYPQQKTKSYLITQPELKNLTISERINIRNPATFNPAEANAKTSRMIGETSGKVGYTDYQRIMSEGRTLTATKTKVKTNYEAAAKRLVIQPITKSSEIKTRNNIAAPITGAMDTTGLVPKVNLGIGYQRVTQQLNNQMMGTDALTSNMLKNRMMPTSSEEVNTKIKNQITGAGVSLGNNVKANGKVNSAINIEIDISARTKANNSIASIERTKTATRTMQGQRESIMQGTLQGQLLTPDTSMIERNDVTTRTYSDRVSVTDVLSKTGTRFSGMLPDLKIGSSSVGMTPGRTGGIGKRVRYYAVADPLNVAGEFF